MYEMLTGKVPFHKEKRSEFYKNIKEGELTFPDSMSEECKDLLSGLLTKDPKKRLGYEDDYTEVKSHPFF